MSYLSATETVTGQWGQPIKDPRLVALLERQATNPLVRGKKPPAPATKEKKPAKPVPTEQPSNLRYYVGGGIVLLAVGAILFFVFRRRS